MTEIVAPSPAKRARKPNLTLAECAVISSSSEALPSQPFKIPAFVLPEQSNKNARKKVTIDDIYEMHLAVLQKEHIKLDLEIENVPLKKQEIMLRIQELESRSNVFS
ncbi:uncharacterized protein LOC122963318 [Acropora millepora]|uniref:uncharacterized protein LOC122963318 n=1 Tax=Acropora millepora TaxID=45264 RepID=UPI001CF5BEC9|nr:uncharacterized protein LOC122963318 [Acropora millepora]